MLYYSDTTILSLLESISMVIQRVTFEDLLTMMKLCHVLFIFLKVLMQSNILVVSVLPPSLFQYFMTILSQGVSCDGK